MTLMDRRRALMGAQPKKEKISTSSTTFKFLDTSISGKAPQGSCAVGDYLYFATVSSDYSEQYLYKCDLKTNTITNISSYSESNSNSLGHANSMTYNPNTGNLYVACQDSTGKVAEIDPATGNIISYKIAKTSDGEPYNCWSIAFDRKRNLFYSRRGSYVIVYDQNWNYLRTITFTNYTDRTTAQGTETDGDYIYLCWSSPSNIVDMYTVTGDFVQSVSIIVTSELEELAYDWQGKFYCNSFDSTGNVKLYDVRIRYYQIAYIHSATFEKLQIGGTITATGTNSIRFASTSAKNYNTIAKGVGYPFIYNFLNGKTVRLECDLVRVAGSAGQFAFSIFTTTKTSGTVGSDRLYQVSKYYNVPETGTRHIVFDFVPGTEWFTPPSDKLGTKVGYWLFTYSDSGNTFDVQNLSIKVLV